MKRKVSIQDENELFLWDEVETLLKNLTCEMMAFGYFLNHYEDKDDLELFWWQMNRYMNIAGSMVHDIAIDIRNLCDNQIEEIPIEDDALRVAK